MKIKITFSAVLFLMFYSLIAQQWSLAKNFSYGGQCFGTGIGTDKLNNIYTVANNVLWKFDSSGNILWQNTLATPLGDRLVTDSMGYSYVTGGNTITLYNSTGQIIWSVNAPIATSSQNIALNPLGGVITVGRVLIGNDTKSVLSRYDQNGNRLWTRTGDFPAGGSTPNSISCDNAGNTYWVGENFINNAVVGFLAKVDNAGNLISTKTIPLDPTGVAISSDNSINVSGQFSNLVINNISYHYNDGAFYFIKYDQSGNVLWYKIITGILGNNAITADKKGNAYLTTSYSSLQIDSISLAVPVVGVIVVKFDSIGNIAWYKNSTLVSTPPASIYPGAICVSSNDDVLITGAVHGMHTFDSFTTTQTNSYTDLLIAKIGQSSVTTAISPSPAIISEFNVYPNPTSRIITINISSKVIKEEFTIKVNNSQGKTVYSEVLKEVTDSIAKQIDLSLFAKGIYFVEIVTNQRKEVKRLVLN